MLNWLKRANAKAPESQRDTALKIPTSDEVIKTFRSRNPEAMQEIKSQILQVFESENLALQQEFLNQYTPKLSIKANLIKGLKGSPEWAVAALSATAQDYAHKRPYELGAVLGDICYQLARKAITVGKPGVPARYLYFGGEAAQSCVISLKQLGQNRNALTYLDEIIPWLEQWDDTEVLPSLYLHRVEINLKLEEIDEADTLLKQLVKLQLSPNERQTYERLRRTADNKLKPPIVDPISESEQVLTTLKTLVAHVEPLLAVEPEAQNDFARLQALLEQLEHQEHLTAKDFALAQQESANNLTDLMMGRAGSVTARAIIATIHETFTKLLELSQNHESKT